MESKLVEIINRLGLTDLLNLSQDEAVGILKGKYRRVLSKHKIDLSRFKSKVTLEKVAEKVVDTPPLPTALSNLSFTPFRHQIEAFNFYLKQENRRCIIADDMGLGKTLTALMIAKFENIRVIIICPASLKTVWARESDKLGITPEIYSYEKCPERIGFDYLLIVDEAHYCQNCKSIRTKKVYQLCIDAYAVLLLTGTPMRNGRPSNLYTLLRMIEHPIVRIKSDFEKRYCDAKETYFSRWDISGASNLDELKVKISDSLIQRKKEDCLDLPEKLYSDIRILPNKKDILDYNNMLSDMVDINPLAKLTAIRVANSHMKIPFLLEYLKTFDESIVIFSPFETTVTLVAETLGVTPFTGNTTLSERTRIIDQFQSGLSKIFIGSIGAGGVGVTLHVASHLIMIDPPFTPGEYHQATDRIHRIGQKKVCNIYNLRCLKVDDYIYDMINSKVSIIESAIPKILNKVLNNGER